MEKKGRVTIPTNKGFEKETADIMKRWGADSIRDCDGTELPDDIKSFGAKVYSTYFVIRGDNDWGRKNPDEYQHLYLMSDRRTAEGDTLEIRLLDGYFGEQIQVDYGANPRKYWEVIDRTTGELVEGWEILDNGNVLFPSKAGHEYTVSFLAFCIWDPVQMYNYITNDWDVDKQLMYDPKYPKTREYIIRHLREWMEANPDTDVIRYTTFLYQFGLVFNDKKKEKFVDWFGYSMSVSPRMIDDFEAEYGYKLRAEYIVDNGYYNSTFRVPTKEYLDYMDFVQRFVTSVAKELIQVTHEGGKEAMMFLGDCWIGAEPYGKYFHELNLDAVVGSVGGGITVRMLTDIQDVRYVEGRFLPYFFPDTFFDGNERAAVDELNRNWLTARRAMMRKPLDRIGYGGYLSLAAKFPSFIDRVEGICEEFRTLHSNVSGNKPYAGIRVAVLNCWGKIRSWQAFMVAHELWYQQIYSYQGILEALSGLPVDVGFISFDDVKNGALKDYDVVINAGGEGTAFSGGEKWMDTELVEIVREWVYNGGGFVGVGEPTAALFGGTTFRLSDVMGVDKEVGFSLSTNKYNIEKKDGFITADVEGAIDYGEGTSNIFALKNTTVLDIEFSDRFRRKVNVGQVKLACNDYGKGRGVYIAGLPFSFQNARLLYRAMFYSAGKEDLMLRAFSSNTLTECHYYPDSKMYAIVNNSTSAQVTDFYDIDGRKQTVNLKSMEIKWVK